MKIILSLILLVLTSVESSAQIINTNPYPADNRVYLAWDYDELSILSGFKLYVQTNGVANPVKIVSVPATNNTTEISLKYVCGGLPNGIYSVYCTAVGRVDLQEPLEMPLESEPTEKLWMFWYGVIPPPNKPTFKIYSTTPPPLPK